MNHRVSMMLGVTILVVLTVVGYTLDPGRTATPPPAPTSAVPSYHTVVHPKSAKPTPETVAQYQTSTQRLSRIYNAVKSFGMVVMAQSRIDGPRGPFDAYCSFAYTDPTSTNPGGYTSQGYKPARGNDCYLQHNPQYGGPSVQISADVLVGKFGEYTNVFVAAFITTSTCAVNVSYVAGNPVPTIAVGWSPHTEWSDEVTTVAHAKAIDNKAVACLDTRP